MPQSFMVTGGTGYQGGSLCRLLLSEGHTVHALVRDPSSDKAKALSDIGAVIFKGGFDDVDVIAAATKGVSGVFLNPFPTPMDPDLQVRQAKNVIDAAVNEKCPLVLSSGIFTADKHKWETSAPEDFLYLYYSRKSTVEAEVRTAGLRSYTILRPAYLMHNYLIPFSNFHYPELSKQGLMRHMYNPGRKYAHLDSGDVGRIAAVALQHPEKYDKLEIDLSVGSLDADDATTAINKAAKRNDVRTERVIIEDFDTQTKTGLTWHYMANIQDTMFDSRKEVLDLFGIKLTTFEEYLEQNRDKLAMSLPLLN